MVQNRSLSRISWVSLAFLSILHLLMSMFAVMGDPMPLRERRIVDLSEDSGDLTFVVLQQSASGEVEYQKYTLQSGKNIPELDGKPQSDFSGYKFNDSVIDYSLLMSDIRDYRVLRSPQLRASNPKIDFAEDIFPVLVARVDGHDYLSLGRMGIFDSSTKKVIVSFGYGLDSHPDVFSISLFTFFSLHMILFMAVLTLGNYLVLRKVRFADSFIHRRWMYILILILYFLLWSFSIVAGDFLVGSIITMSSCVIYELYQRFSMHRLTKFST